MKRDTFSIMVVFLAAAILRPAFANADKTATSEPSEPVAGLSEAQKAQLAGSSRNAQNLTPEERRQIISDILEPFGPVRGALLPDASWDSFSGEPGEPNIEEQLSAEHEQRMAELKEILALANKEKAAQTAARLEALIGKRQKAFQEKIETIREKRHELALLQMRFNRKPMGKKAPDFTLKSFDGKETSLASLKGKIVVLEWMNFECPFSKYHYETKTTMADMAKKYKNKGVVWLAVNSTNHTKAAANTAFAKKHKLGFPILNDIPGKVGKAYGAKTTPHIFVIDKTGSIAYDGAIDNAPLGKVAKNEKYVNYVSGALDALLGGKPITTKQTKPYGCSVKYAK